MPNKIVKQEKKRQLWRMDRTVLHFLKGKKNESDEGKKMWLLFLLHSFIHQERTVVWQAALITGVYLLYLKKDRLYMESAGIKVHDQHTTVLLPPIHK